MSSSTLSPALIPDVDVVVSWSTSFDRALWQRLSETWDDLTSEVQDIESIRPALGVSTGPLVVMAGPLLPLDAETRIVWANVGVARRSSEITLSWRVYAQRPPIGAPPAMMKQKSEAFGGPAALAAFFAEIWKQDGPPVAAHRVKFVAPDNTWRCCTMPRAVTDDSPDAASLGLAAGDIFLEQVGYRARNPSGNGIREVSVVYHHGPGHFDTTILAHGPIEIRQRWFTFADAVRDQVLAALFRPVED